MTDPSATPWVPPRWIPPSGQLEKQVAEWLAAAAKSAPKKWLAGFGLQAELEVERVESALPTGVIATLSESTVGIALELPSLPGQFAFLAFERSTLFAMLATLMGEPGAVVPEDRDFTAIERSLLDYLIEQFLGPIQAAWPGDEPIRFRPVAVGAAKSTCRLPTGEPAIKAALKLNGSFGSGRIVLLLPLAELTNDVRRTGVSRGLEPFERRSLEALIGEMPVSLSVTLGGTRLSFPQLAKLKPGDLIVLDQRISDPLSAQVAGRDKFQVWPGALGRQQAIRVESSLK